jgi:propanediol utilization protein
MGNIRRKRGVARLIVSRRLPAAECAFVCACSDRRELTFGDVLIRVDPSFTLAMHIDTDEANAADIAKGASGRIAAVQAAE